ncbi:MAG: hypothetical protein IT344_06505 [Candidatus Dadabacteria bacterium]|nr:hypothetical protein [Candidatus Dadabacteria bacterium]
MHTKLTALKPLLFLTAVILTLLAARHDAPAQTRTHDFRKTRWGMSPAQVKLTENSIPTGEGPVPPYDFALTYNGKLGELDAEIGYMFTDDKLVLGGYAVTVQYDDPAQYAKNYETVKAALTEEYGAPALEDAYWKDDASQTGPEGYGKAVAEGALLLQAAWREPGTEIFLTLEGKSGQTVLSALYYSTELNPRVEERRLQQELKEFSEPAPGEPGDTQPK